MFNPIIQKLSQTSSSAPSGCTSASISPHPGFVDGEFTATHQVTKGTAFSSWYHPFQMSALNVSGISPWWSNPITIVFLIPDPCLCPTDTSSAQSSPRLGLSACTKPRVVQFKSLRAQLSLYLLTVKQPEKGMSSQHITVLGRKSFQSQTKNTLSTIFLISPYQQRLLSSLWLLVW